MQADLGLSCLHKPETTFAWHGPFDGHSVSQMQVSPKATVKLK